MSGFIPNSAPELPEDLDAEVQSVDKEFSTFFDPANQPNGQPLSPELSQIQNIAAIAQNFIDVSLMGRGLTVDRFSAAAPGPKWSKSYPYRFLVTSVDSKGKHSIIAEYRLPIAPQELSVTSNFAIKTTVTSRGILEEHNGVPIKMIQFSGSTGIMIERADGGRAQKSTSILGSIFSGTVEAAQQSIKQVNNLVNQFTGGKATNTSNSESLALSRTGYYQFQMLDLFLHTYVEAKKSPGTQSYRLVFDMAKDNVQYIVTPMTFVKRRTAQSPMEYMYNVQLLAWGTVPDWKGDTDSADASFLNASPDDFHRALNTLTQMRRTVQSFSNIVSAVRADVESNIFGPLNQVILLAKDVLSLPLAIADLPKALRDSFQTSVAANWQALSATNEDLKNLFDSKFQSIIQEGSGSSSYLGATADQAGGASAPTSMFKPDVLDSLDLTEKVNLDQIPQNNAQQVAVQAAIDAANSITTNDINNLINQIGSLVTALEPQITLLDPLEPEWDLLYSLNDSQTELYGLIANGQLDTSSNDAANADGNAFLSTSALAYWQQTTTDNNINYTTPSAKFSVPFPLGSTIEQLALIYLGDATRWMEIVSLNGLQAPYVDENGFTYAFIGNGSDNQINIPSATNLYVNQTVYLSSNTQLSSKRQIQAIAQVSDTNWLITLDGPANLDLFTTQDNAQLMAFLPYTVNSMSQIYIPTTGQPTTDELDTPAITFLTDDIDMIKFSKIDWLLTPQGDLDITKDGFQNLAFGKTNLYQAAKMKLITKPKSLILHPEFGAGVEVGSSFADVNLDSLAKRISKAFKEDPRFLPPKTINLNASPGVLQEQIVAMISKDNGVLPITLPLTK